MCNTLCSLLGESSFFRGKKLNENYIQFLWILLAVFIVKSETWIHCVTQKKVAC